MDLFCEKCTLQFDKKYAFDLHLSSVHGVKIEVMKKPLICEENVPAQVNENDVLDNVVNNSLTCDTCDSSFKSKKSLKRHITSVHEGKKSFKCDLCGTSFTGKSSLKRHVATVHEEKKPFKCAICDFKFSKKSVLKNHMVSVLEEIKR